MGMPSNNSKNKNSVRLNQISFIDLPCFSRLSAWVNYRESFHIQYSMLSGESAGVFCTLAVCKLACLRIRVRPMWKCVCVRVDVRVCVCFQSWGRVYRWWWCEVEGGQSLPYLTGPGAEGLFDSVVALCYWSLIVWHFFSTRMDREGWRDGVSDF